MQFDEWENYKTEGLNKLLESTEKAHEGKIVNIKT